MNPSLTQHPPTRPQQPPPNHKADQVVFRFLRKFVSLVADARISDGDREDQEDPQSGIALLSSEHEEAASAPTQRVDTGGAPTSPPAEGGSGNSEGEPARVDVDKWFNLEISGVDVFNSALDTFKHISTTFPTTTVETTIEPPPLIVQVLLSLPQPLPDDRVLILNHGDQQIRIENSPRYILLESWRVDITQRVPGVEHSLPTPDMSTTSSSGSPRGRPGGSMLGRGLACVRCRNRKQRCDAQQPSCSNCIAAQADCQYATLPVRARPKPQMTAGEALAAKLARLQEQYDSLITKVTHTPTSAPTDGDPRTRSSYHSRSSTSGPSDTETGDEDVEILPGPSSTLLTLERHPPRLSRGSIAGQLLPGPYPIVPPPFIPPSLSASGGSSLEDLNLPATYKQCITLFRSLYTLLRILPAWRLRRQLQDLQAGSGGGMTLEMRVGVPSASSSATSSLTDLAPIIDGSAIVDFDHSLSEQHHSANGVNSMALPPVPSPLGDLCLSLTYRNETKFTLKSLQSSDLTSAGLETDRFSRSERASTSLNPPSNTRTAGAQINRVTPAELLSTFPGSTPDYQISSNPAAVSFPREDEAGDRPRWRPVTPPEDDEFNFLADFSSTVTPIQQGIRENRSTGEGPTTALVQDPSTIDMNLTNSDIHPGNQNDIPLSISPSSRIGSLLMESLTAGTQPSARPSTSSDAIAGFVSLRDSLPSSNVDSYSYRNIPLSFTPLPSSDSTMGPTSHARRSPAADVLGTRWQPGDLIKFNGDGRECERFVFLIREAARHHGKLDDLKWVAAFASTCLTGDALRWYTGLDGDTQDNWELLAPALLNKFSSPTLDEQLEAKPGSAGWRSSIPISADGSLPQQPPEESGSAEPYPPTFNHLSPTSAVVWPPQSPEQPLHQPRDGSPNSGSLVESAAPQEIDLLQELASIEINSMPSTKDIVDLLLAIGRAIPKAIRNKHQLYRLLIRSRDLCNHLHLMLHSEIGSSTNTDIFKRCWEIMDRLERALLDLANIVSEDMLPLGESSLANWENSCQRLRQLYNELTTPPFDACDISDSVYAERDRYFDDCSWSSLVLVAGIEVPAQTMYLSEGGIPFEAQDVLDRLDYLVNELRLNGSIDERTRELVIIIISDTAKVAMKGPMEASLDFWKDATVALQAIDPENRLDQRMAETLQNSWSCFVDRQLRAPSPPRSSSPAISRHYWMMFHNYATQNEIVWSETQVGEEMANGTVFWAVLLFVTRGGLTSSFKGGPAVKKIEARNMAARLALTALGANLDDF